MNIYDPDGNEIPIEEWGNFDREEHQKADIVGDWLVSTVWLGLDHNFYGGPPLIYETMIFPRPRWWSWRRLQGKHPFHDEYCERYATREQAYARHELIVRVMQHRFHPHDLQEVI